MPRSNGQLALITLTGTAASVGGKTYALELSRVQPMPATSFEHADWSSSTVRYVSVA